MPDSDPQRQPMLLCTQGPRQGERFVVGARGLLLGRAEHCDIVLDDQGVSREHARVILHNDAVWAQDAGSRNGCFVNGKRLLRHKQLSPGDDLVVGDHHFSVELADPFPGHESVSTFGAPPPDALPDLPALAPPPRSPALFVGIAVVLLAAAAAFAWVLGGG